MFNDSLLFHHKRKGKVVPVLLTEHDAMQAYLGSGGIVPLFFINSIFFFFTFILITVFYDTLFRRPTLPTTTPSFVQQPFCMGQKLFSQ
jgi:hypothetical protein